MVAAGPVAFLGEHPMPMLKKPPVYSVCLTRQELFAIRQAMARYHEDHIREHGAWDVRDEDVITHRQAIMSARKKVFLTLHHDIHAAG